MPRKKAEKGEANQVDLYNASARDALERAATELSRLGDVAVNEGLIDFAGKALVAERMVRGVARTFPGAVQGELTKQVVERKARKPRAPKVDERQETLIASESNGVSVSE